MEPGKKINKMDRVQKVGLMEQNTQVYFKILKIKASIEMEKNMEKENCYLLMAVIMMENFIRTIFMG